MRSISWQGSGRDLDWRDLGDVPHDQESHPATLTGWLSRPDLANRRILVAEPPCCTGCFPSSADARVDITTTTGLAEGMTRLSGTLRRIAGRWTLSDARPIRGIGRRGLLAAAPLLCLAAAAPEPPDPKAVTAGAATVDLHSHAGRVKDVVSARPFTPVADPMREGGLGIVCLAIVPDAPTHKVMPDHRIHPFRDPAPGELRDYTEKAFARLHALAREQSMPIVTDLATLRAATPDRPAIVVSAEGADFLEGDPARVDDAHNRWQLRHLQLTHYRVNELGDIQTEPPVHGGLTDVGAAVIQRCNARGVVVDVAHGTLDLVRRAASVTTRPLVLSHTSLTTNPRPFTRLITPEHAKLIADTNGVIGIWPIASLFPDMDALAHAMARMASVVGVDHVGLGSDTLGLVGAATFDSYARLHELTAALLRAGFSPTDVRKLRGENYVRVFEACMA